jgi:hypothetical protein
MVEDEPLLPAEPTASEPLATRSNGNSESLVAASKPAPTRSRPKLDLSSFTNPAGSRNGERRKGKSIFGVVLGTLNKAKIEDKERNASEAVSSNFFISHYCSQPHILAHPQAKKRQNIDARLQAKLSREQSVIRKQDEARKDRMAAVRKQDDLNVKNNLVSGRCHCASLENHIERKNCRYKPDTAHISTTPISYSPPMPFLKMST